MQQAQKQKHIAQESYFSQQAIDNLRETSKNILVGNFKSTGEKYITPAWPHYKNQWVWDSSFHAISCAELGMKELALNEIRKLFEYQDERGWIPHMMFHKYRRLDPEIPLYGLGFSPPYSRLVGQPVIAQAVEAIGDKDFTKEVADKLVKFYKYFIEYRDAENVLSIITPRESGRDAAPEFDFFRPVAPKPVKFFEKVLDPLFMWVLDFRYMLMDWEEERIFQKNIFHVKDVAEHCIFIDGLYSLEKLLVQVDKKDLFPDIGAVIKKCEKALFDRTWDEETKTFYPVRVTKKGSEQIKELSLGALYPILLRELPKDAEESILNHLTDPQKFWTEYPVPTVPANSPKFDPASTFPLWRGPTWINSNWFIIRGLMRNGYTEIARRIAGQTIEMINNNGVYEFYNPLTGKGLRVKDFGWSTLVVTFPGIIEQ